MTVTINGTTGYTGPIGAIGDLSTTGNTTLGDASGDTLTINGNTASIPNGLNFTNGNIGVGATPSTWNSNGRGIQLFNSANRVSAFATWYGAIGVLNDAYYGTDNNFKYYSGGAVSLYQQSAGVHTWQSAGSGTAGSTITWANSMTFDASGNLGLGVTPSAWVSPFKAIQLGTYGQYIAGQTNSPDLKVGSNQYYNGTNFVYSVSGF